MKILCVIDSLGSGGAQRQLVAIAKGIKANGNDVSFLVYHDESFYLQELVDNNIAYYCLDGDGYLKRILRIRKFIRNGEYDGVISFLEGANFITTLAGFPFRKWKLVVGERNANPNILKSYKLRFYRFLHLFTDFIVSNSQTNIDMVTKINPLLKKGKLRVIYNSVDNTKWIPSTEYTPYNNSKYSILVASSHQHHKNAQGLIEAVHMLPSNLKNKIVINWYGDESPDSSYKQNLLLLKQYNLEKIIFFHKATNDIRTKMQYADVVGLFSKYEGLPNVICEAMTIGKPVMSSNVSDLPFLLNGTNNILFDPQKKTEIIKAFEKLITTSKKELFEIGLDNRSISLNLFENKTIIKNYISLLK